MEYQNKVLAIITDRLPDNCDECICSEGMCHKPFRRKYNEYGLAKPYLTKRHKECPLRLKYMKDGAECQTNET